jgi:hypothetical protein
VVDSKKSYVAPLGDLLDLLTVTNLRISHSIGDAPSELSLREILVSDVSKRVVDQEIEVRDILVDIVTLAQTNQEIWSLKDEMHSLDPSSQSYAKLLVLAHQLNGVRNKARNRLSSLDESSTQLVRSNTETDGLERH